MVCPGEWKHGLKPAVPWCFNIDPHPFQQMEDLKGSMRQTQKAKDSGLLGTCLMLENASEEEENASNMDTKQDTTRWGLLDGCFIG